MWIPQILILVRDKGIFHFNGIILGFIPGAFFTHYKNTNSLRELKYFLEEIKDIKKILKFSIVF